MTRATGLPEQAHKSQLCSPSSKSTLRSFVKSRSFFDAPIDDERSARDSELYLLPREATVYARVRSAGHRFGTKLWGAKDKGVNLTLKSVWSVASDMQNLIITLECLQHYSFFSVHDFFCFPKHLHWPLRYSTMLERTEAFDMRHNSTCSYLPPKSKVTPDKSH